jgi:hypothetical protein
MICVVLESIEDVSQGSWVEPWVSWEKEWNASGRRL